MRLTAWVSFWVGLPIVIFGGLIHCGRWRSDRGREHLATWSRTHQSKRKDDTDDQKRCDHYRATEKASAGSGPASPGPQILLAVGSPGLETLLPVTGGPQRSANVKLAWTATYEPPIFPLGLAGGIWSSCSYAVEFSFDGGTGGLLSRLGEFLPTSYWCWAAPLY